MACFRYTSQTQTFLARGKGRPSSGIAHATSTSKEGTKSPAPLSAKEEAMFRALSKRKHDLNQNSQLGEDAGKFKYHFI